MIQNVVRQHAGEKHLPTQLLILGYELRCGSHLNTMHYECILPFTIKQDLYKNK